MKESFLRVKTVHPLIHAITNNVTVNDCANLLLACGASPLMADEPEEAEEITKICSGLVLNLGTLNTRSIRAMYLAGKRAHQMKHPVVLDPVGAGASRLRTETALGLLKDARPQIVRCNISELKMLQHSGTVSRGVDASAVDCVTEDNLNEAAEMLRAFAKQYSCITAVSGAIDLIASPEGQVHVIRNGHPMMARITGSGCMLSALTAAFAAANPDQLFEAVSDAFCCMGIAGEHAFRMLQPGEGNASFRTHLIDAVDTANPEVWETEVRCEVL